MSYGNKSGYDPTPVLPPRTFRCDNITCPVETFKGITIMPLNSCPACQHTGSPL